MTNKNIIGLWENVSRAYEIALLGGFSIKIIFNTNYLQGYDDYNTLAGYYKDVIFCNKGVLSVEIYKPDDYNKVSKETLLTLISRVNKAKKNPLPTVFKNDTCPLILKTATNIIGFSYNQYTTVIKVASFIAQLDKAEYIEAHHLAEAIQYINYKNY